MKSLRVLLPVLVCAIGLVSPGVAFGDDVPGRNFQECFALDRITGRVSVGLTLSVEDRALVEACDSAVLAGGIADVLGLGNGGDPLAACYASRCGQGTEAGHCVKKAEVLSLLTRIDLYRRKIHCQ